jgi:Ca2+-binding RTX toxin-like protein
VAPAVTSLTGDATGVRGQLRSFQGAFSDVGTRDTWTAVANFGDGTGDQPLTLNADKSFAFGHVFTATGAYTVKVTVTDDDGGVSVAAQFAVTINAVEMQGGDLVVGGTTGPDNILFTGTGSGVVLTLNGQPMGLFQPTGRVIAFGQAGNDNIQASSTLANGVEFYGGGGNDGLIGGAGASILLGGAGDDSLTAGPGRTLMIGGEGADGLAGGSADDILIGGTTAHDSDAAALRRILNAWTAGVFATRVNNIRAGLFAGTPADPHTGLNSGTVFDDAAVDTITGNGGSDWVFSSGPDVRRDTPEALN